MPDVPAFSHVCRWTRERGRTIGLCLTLAALPVACSSPVTPTPPAAAPALSCPVQQTVVSSDNLPTAVIFPKPTLTGGTAPVSSSCTPDIGSVFPLGTTTVTCTTLDAQQRSAACSFTVVVKPARTLSVSRVLAFGDSITEGKTAAGFTPLHLTGVGCPVADRVTSYPHVLGASIASAYPTQTIGVTNCGFGGETAVEGIVRLPTGLSTGAFDVVLIMEGANDLSEVSQTGGSQATAVDRVANSVVAMIRAARSGRTVFVGTLTPQRVNSPKASRPDWIVPVNNRLRTVVPAEGAVLVDVYAALGGSPDPYIDIDGLHPTIAGHQKIAAAFFDAVRQRFEVTTTTVR